MKYDTATKQQTVTLYREHGTAETSRRTGIEPRTIRLWAKNAGATAERQNERRDTIDGLQVENERRRAEFHHELFAKCVDLLRRMDQPHIDFRGKDARMVTYPIASSQDVKNYALAVGILLDKARLEEGKTTGRTETVTIDEATRVMRSYVERGEVQAEEFANTPGA
jgi:transposase-like protein